MICPNCGTEIDFVRVFAEASQRGCLGEENGKFYIQSWDDTDVSGDNEEIECPECYEEIGAFIGSDTSSEIALSVEEWKAAKIKADELAKIAGTGSPIPGLKPQYAVGRVFSVEKETVHVKIESKWGWDGTEAVVITYHEFTRATLTAKEGVEQCLQLDKN